MSLRSKLLARIAAPAKRFARSVEKLARKLQHNGWGSRAYSGSLKQHQERRYPPGQWHRWYRANRKYQRQMTALRRAGIDVSDNANDLPRWMIP